MARTAKFSPVSEQIEKCDKCSFKLSRKHLKDNVNRTHQEITFQCDQCEKAFTEENPLQSYVQFVNKTYQLLCHKCTLKGNTQGNFDKHILWILDIKEPQCIICQMCHDMPT